MQEKENLLGSSIPVKIREDFVKSSFSPELKREKVMFGIFNSKLLQLEKGAKVLVDPKSILPPPGEEKSPATIPDETKTLVLRIDKINRYIQQFLHGRSKTKNSEDDELNSKFISACKEACHLIIELSKSEATMDTHRIETECQISKLEQGFQFKNDESLASKNRTTEFYNAFKELKCKHTLFLVFVELQKKMNRKENHNCENITQSLTDENIRNQLKYLSCIDGPQHLLLVQALMSKNLAIDYNIFVTKSKIEKLQNSCLCLEIENTELLLSSQISFIVNSNVAESLKLNAHCSSETSNKIENDLMEKMQEIDSLNEQVRTLYGLIKKLKLQCQLENDKLSSQYQLLKRQYEIQRIQFLKMTNVIRVSCRQLSELRSPSNDPSLKHSKEITEMQIIISELDQENYLSLSRFNSAFNDFSAFNEKKDSDMIRKLLDLHSIQIKDKGNFKSAIVIFADEKMDNYELKLCDNSYIFQINVAIQKNKALQNLNKKYKIQLTAIQEELKHSKMAKTKKEMYIESLKSQIANESIPWKSGLTTNLQKLEAANKSYKNLLKEETHLEIEYKVLADICNSLQIYLPEQANSNDRLKSELHHRSNNTEALEGSLNKAYIERNHTSNTSLFVKPANCSFLKGHWRCDS